MPNDLISEEEADQDKITDESMRCDQIQIEMKFEAFREDVNI
jgi:hypothetical protein